MDNIHQGMIDYQARLKIRNEEIANLKKSYDLKPKKEKKIKIKKDVSKVKEILNKLASQKFRTSNPVSISQIKRPTIVIKARPYHSNFFTEEFSQGGQ